MRCRLTRHTYNICICIHVCVCVFVCMCVLEKRNIVHACTCVLVERAKRLRHTRVSTLPDRDSGTRMYEDTYVHIGARIRSCKYTRNSQKDIFTLVTSTDTTPLDIYMNVHIYTHTHRHIYTCICVYIHIPVNAYIC